MTHLDLFSGIGGFAYAAEIANAMAYAANDGLSSSKTRDCVGAGKDEGGLLQSQVMGGFRTIAHSELEPFACEVNHRHYPESVCLGAVQNVCRNTNGNHRELWQTPTRALAEHRGQERSSELLLAGQVKQNGHGKLNPHWVATLMGYPPLWAEIGLRFITGRSNSRDTATLSSRKSRQS